MFWSDFETLSVEDGLKQDIQGLIRERDKRYTESEIESGQGLIQAKEKILAKTTGIENKIASISSTTTTLDVKLNNTNKPQKWKIDSKDTDTKIIYKNTGNTMSYTIRISKLRYFTVENLVDDNKLLDLWNEVNDYIIKRDIRVAKQANYDQYPQHRSEIERIIRNTNTVGTPTLGSFITGINRGDFGESADLIINLKPFNEIDNLLYDDFVKLSKEEQKVKKGYIISDITSNNSVLRLKWLSFTNPNSFFKMAKEYYHCLYHLDEITSQAFGENTIIVPKIIGMFWDAKNKERFRNWIFPDTQKDEIAEPTNGLNFNGAIQDTVIDSFKWPLRLNNNGSYIPLDSIIYNRCTVNYKLEYPEYLCFLNNIVYTSIASWCKTPKNNGEIILPKDIIEMRSAPVAVTDIYKVTTWAYILGNNIPLTNDYNTVINLMTTNAKDFEMDAYSDFYPNIGAINVKYKSVYDKIQQNWPSPKVKYTPNI